MPKPWHVDRKVNFSVYPSHRCRKGVSQWNIVFCCVRVVYRHMENHYLPHVLIRFAQVRPKGECQAIAEGTSSIQVMPEKPVTPLFRILDLSPPPITHLYTHDRTPSRLRRDFDAPKSPLQRNPGMLTVKLTFPSTPSIDVGRKCPNGIFCLVVLG